MTFNNKGTPPHAYKQQGCDKSPNTLVTPLLSSTLSLLFFRYYLGLEPPNHSIKILLVIKIQISLKQAHKKL